MEDELKGKKPNNDENVSGIKSVKSEKEILEYIMKTNESLNNELSNYREMYESTEKIGEYSHFTIFRSFRTLQ